MYTDTEQHHGNFLETYVGTISPKLKEIDLFVKTAEGEMDVGQAARLLSVTVAEIRGIMRKNKLASLNRLGFFTVMAQGSSGICGLYRREVDCGSPYVYTREHISYIYGLDIDTVNEACDKLHIKEVTNYTLPILFSNIMV